MKLLKMMLFFVCIQHIGAQSIAEYPLPEKHKPPPANFNVPKFSPGPSDHSHYHFFDEETTVKTAIQLSLDASFNRTEKLSESFYSPIDYNKTIEAINETKTYKNLSYAHFMGFVRYMAFNKSQKRFIINREAVIE